MVDWGMRVPFAKPVIGKAEIEAVTRVLNQSRLSEGPNIPVFEEAFRDFAKGGMAIAVSSCTAALHLLWRELGIGPDHEIVMPALTHAATAHAIEGTGAKVRLCDVGDNGNMRPGDIPDDVDGICVVHFLGQPCAMPGIMEAAGNRPVVEDCALALGAGISGRHVGLFGSGGAFSFYPAKHITTGEGGMILTTSAKLARRLKLARAFGKVTDVEFDVIQSGLNYRISEIAAAIGIQQMRRLPDILTARRRNSLRLLGELHPRAIGSDYAVSYIAADEDTATRIRNVLHAAAIETSRYYPKPVHRLKYFREKYGWREGDFPNAERISACSVTLPVGPHINEERIDKMIRLIGENE